MTKSMSAVKDFEYEKLSADSALKETKKTKNTKKKGYFWRWLVPLFLVILVIVLLLCVGTGTFAVIWLRRNVPMFTVEEGLDLPILEMSDLERDSLEARIDHYKNQCENGRNPGNLDDEGRVFLTAEELNGIISDSEFLRGNLFVTMKEGKLVGQMSFPAQSLPGGKGRFFNGLATISQTLPVHDNNEDDDGLISMTLDTPPVKAWDDPDPLATASFGFKFHNGLVFLRLRSARFMGHVMSEKDIEEHSEVIGHEFYDDHEEVAQTMSFVQSFGIHDDEIVVETHDENGVMHEGARDHDGGVARSEGHK